MLGLIIVAFASLLPLSLSSAPPELPESTEELVDFSARLEPDIVRHGEIPRVILEVDLEKDWHIYSVVPIDKEDAPRPTTVSYEPGWFVEDGPLYETRPIGVMVDVLGYRVYYHQDHAALYQNLKLAQEVSAGFHTADVSIHYQLCTDQICLPTETRTLSLSFRVEPGPPRGAYLAADRTINPLPTDFGASDLSSMLSGGFWAFLGLAALMGLASLLTPCVFPMIPITISFFSKQAEGKQHRVIKLAVLFAAGIILTYTGFGLIMSILFGAGSALSLAANPVVNLVIALVFIVFAFSLMGLFDISLTASIQTYFDQKSRSMGGAAGVLLMGFTFTLTALTCTVQFVGTMLIAASQGEWMWPLFGMIIFSAVFAFPFFLLAVAPGFIGKMQGRSGAWLGRSKFVLGVLELMASLKFISNADLVWQTNLISRNTALIIWIVLIGVIVVYLVWTGVRPTLNRSPWQWLSVAIFIIIGYLISTGWNGQSLGSLIDAVLPPPSGYHLVSGNRVSQVEAEKMIWLDDLEAARQLAEKEQKPIFLEFTGYTCVNCRWMEQNVLSLKPIHNTLRDDYILVRLFTDGGKDARRNMALQIDRFHTVALPFYVRLAPDNSIQSTFSGISLNPGDFLTFLTKPPPTTGRRK